VIAIASTPSLKASSRDLVTAQPYDALPWFTSPWTE
jgi:hypothetical protein